MSRARNDATDQLSFELHTTARLLRRNYDRRARAHGLTRAKWQVLWSLSREQGVKQAELAERLDVAPISLTRQLDVLEQEGLLERRRDDQDRRCFRIYLTAAAQPALTTLRELADLTRSEALAGLNHDDIVQLKSLLERIRMNLGREE